MLHQITRPTLLVDEDKVRKNIKKMASKASENKITLRPHFKTHQSAAIGEWFLDAGITQAAVSSVEMAKYFAKVGWKDITLAFPYNPLEYREIESLAKEIKLNLLIVSKKALEHLNSHVNVPLEYFIKVDVGTHRTGVLPSAEGEIKTITSENKKHKLSGLLAHAGHAYQPLNTDIAKEIFQKGMDQLLSVRKTLGMPSLKISWGDTPTCSLLDEFPQVDELRPGNFTFYDLMQHSYNVCSLEEIAVCLACPVVSIHPSRNEAVVYGGGVHLSKDFINDEQGKLFGQVVSLSEEGWNASPVARMARLSQEHGIIKGSPEYINSLQIGTLVGILPVHSCLTADLQGYYISLAGEKLEKLNRKGL